MCVLHIANVVTNKLHPLQLTIEIITIAPRDGTESLVFYVDLVKFLNLCYECSRLKVIRQMNPYSLLISFVSFYTCTWWCEWDTAVPRW
jgi:hypothetical protein